MRPISRLRDERGMTLAELMLATVISLVVLTIALAFFNSQAKALKAGTGQFTLTQNYRMALSTLATQVRAAGVNIVPGQPFLVYAGPSAIALNADYVSREPNDLFAESIDTMAPPTETEALQKGDALTIPGSTFTYPDTSYRNGSANSGAETIVFYFAPDTTTPRADDYALYREVDKGLPVVVARNILQTPGLPFFQYLYQLPHDTAAVTIEVYSGIELTHPAPVHGKLDGARPDTGTAARIDQIRGVRVNLTTTDGTTGATERRRSVTRTIVLANAGVTRLETCGEVPQFGSALSPAVSAPAATPKVTLSWSPAIDESAGEKDVMRYVLWKRLAGTAGWGPPYAIIASGLSSYVYVDDQVDHGRSYDYAIAAQDCTPSESPQTIVSNVTVP